MSEDLHTAREEIGLVALSLYTFPWSAAIRQNYRPFFLLFNIFSYDDQFGSVHERGSATLRGSFASMIFFQNGHCVFLLCSVVNDFRTAARSPPIIDILCREVFEPQHLYVSFVWFKFIQSGLK